jgi:hypothetical protein
VTSLFSPFAQKDWRVEEYPHPPIADSHPLQADIDK